MSGCPKAYAAYSREYNIWAMMKQRCRNPKAANYVNYGAKGVTVDPCWDRFADFFKDVGPAPSPQHTLDRVNNALGYTPRNCRWADVPTQQNNRTNGRHFEYEGQQLSAPQLARMVGIPAHQMEHRLKKMGLTPAQAMALPKGSWVQRPVLQKSLDGRVVGQHASLAAAAQSLATDPTQVEALRKRLWESVKHSRAFLDCLWEYAG